MKELSTALGKETIDTFNTGSHSGREVLQLYCEAPCGRLGKPARVLVGFKKTCDLAPGEAQEVKISAPLASFASYDDENEFAYLLENGEYIFYLGSDMLLAPGMNIHRNPLCGRNFEYYSEDPLLTGFMASAAVRGIQSAGASACPKHFACNNQETNRIYNDSRLSERALREIYLKGFEICVKTAHPQNIMTSYNKINGVWGHYNYELCEMILRREWGYEGNIMTDWWMRSSKSPEFPKMRDQAYRVRAGVNVLMPGGSRGSKRKPDGTLLKTYKNTTALPSASFSVTLKGCCDSL